MTSGQDGPVLAVWPCNDDYYVGQCCPLEYIRQIFCVQIPRNASAKEIGHFHPFGARCRAAGMYMYEVNNKALTLI
jgi:hypothetical protein